MGLPPKNYVPRCLNTEVWVGKTFPMDYEDATEKHVFIKFFLVINCSVGMTTKQNCTFVTSRLDHQFPVDLKVKSFKLLKTHFCACALCCFYHFTLVAYWHSIVVRPPVLPACFPYPCARLTAGRVTTLWVKRPLSVNQQACHPSWVG